MIHVTRLDGFSLYMNYLGSILIIYKPVHYGVSRLGLQECLIIPAAQCKHILTFAIFIILALMLLLAFVV